ncbi:hypothetical protein A2U01_0072478 [Trifolium medium]|uniref:Uncharacterized protein n=1 Tax=Trifolium medium TaxID=97028 RepID=A0A392SSP1_9FABA|nr:hypothetical protein [Trifolium medium]
MFLGRYSTAAGRDAHFYDFGSRGFAGFLAFDTFLISVPKIR